MPSSPSRATTRGSWAASWRSRASPHAPLALRGAALSLLAFPLQRSLFAQPPRSFFLRGLDAGDLVEHARPRHARGRGLRIIDHPRTAGIDGLEVLLHDRYR